MDCTLVLNATYEPLQIVPWQKAIRMLFQNKVEVVAEHDRVIHSVSLCLPMPSVLRLLYYVNVKRYHHRVKFTRSNLYARDNYRCQYCGRRFPASMLTYDHVIPVARGGPKSWENIVTCYIGCNRRKGSRTPDEAGLRPLIKPKAPNGFPHKIYFHIQQKQAPESWREFIFWSSGVEA